MIIDTKVKPLKRETETTTGFLGGLNTFQDQTIIRDSELTEAKNIVLSVDGIEPRYGTLNTGDTASDSIIYGLFPYYKSDGTSKFLRISGARVKYLNGSTWSAIGSTVYANSNTNMIQARDYVLFFNGSDDLRVYDGSTITVYTALTTPVSLAVVATGTTGSTAYSYRVSAFNAQGETLACTAVNIANGNATLSSTNYNKLDWTAVTNAVGYNIYGRKATGLTQTYMTTVYTNTYNDTGADTPSTSMLPPEGNSTAGIKGKYGCFAISRVFSAGDTANPSRLYWGGVGSNILNFSGAPEGGGYVDVFKNDGQVITAIVPFQGGVIVGKTNAVYKFSFDDNGDPRLEEITRSFGIASHRAIKHVENDLIFPAKKDGRVAFYSLGNVENFSSAILRTNELSIKIASDLEDVNLANLEETSSFYFRNIYGCAIARESSSVNNRIWCLDTRFGAWVHWDDIKANCFSEFTSSDGTQELYYGSEDTGYVVKMFQEDRNDNGSPINVQFATKSYNQKSFFNTKRYRDPKFQFIGVNRSAAINGEVILDGNINEETFPINRANIGGAGFGAMLFGQTLFGTATGGSPADNTASDQPLELDRIYEARSIKYRFRSNSTDLYFKFLALAHDFEVLGTPLDQSYRSY